ncbi:glutathione S-transferase Mu 2-like [Uloborus diversus]|uniref:glutathione S-transferase Mu 2-like n=1 Tax=Uloborus diversus TaxID=327109 RepID=UPI00240A6A94|nr:glutathione S-transferase Mu 2-like [Uloborus diversus]
MSGPTGITLGYWNIRGLAQPIRLMLKYCNVEYEDKRYCYGPAPQFSRDEWFREKETLGLDFPNLPYLITNEGGESVKLTQSLAVIKYVAAKYGLIPLSPKPHHQARLVMIEQQVADFYSHFTGMCYDPDFEKKKESYLEIFPGRLQKLSNFLGKNKWFGIEEEKGVVKLSYVDFMAYHYLEEQRTFEPHCLDKFENLKAFMQRFEELPQLKEYLKSDEIVNLPYNGDMAYFGSRSHPVQKP